MILSGNWTVKVVMASRAEVTEDQEMPLGVVDRILAQRSAMEGLSS